MKTLETSIYGSPEFGDETRGLKWGQANEIAYFRAMLNRIDMIRKVVLTPEAQKLVEDFKIICESCIEGVEATTNVDQIDPYEDLRIGPLAELSNLLFSIQAWQIKQHEDTARLVIGDGNKKGASPEEITEDPSIYPSRISIESLILQARHIIQTLQGQEPEPFDGDTM